MAVVLKTRRIAYLAVIFCCVFSGDVAKGLPTSSGSSILSAPRQPDVRAGRAVNFTPGTGALAVCYLSLTRSGGRFGLG